MANDDVLQHCSNITAARRRLVHLDWDRDGVANWRHDWGVRGRSSLRGGLLTNNLQLFDGDAWQNRFNDKQTIWSVARLDVALRQVDVQLLRNDELAHVVARNVVVLLLDFMLSLNGDASLLWRDFDLDFLWLVALDVEAQVQVARAIWVDRDRVDKGVVFNHVGWAEDNIAHLVWQHVAHPVVHFAEHWGKRHHGGLSHPVARRTPVGHWPVGHWSPVRQWAPAGHWPVVHGVHWPVGHGVHGVVWHHWKVRHDSNLRVRRKKREYTTKRRSE